MTMNVLFVCTGNTCRSPMAEAIARDVIARMHASTDAVAAGVSGTTSSHEALTRERISVGSAGVSTGRGIPATPEAITALRDLGIEPDLRGSRPLTRAMIEQADRVYVMTRSHLWAVVDLVPEAEGKVAMLDPSGRDIDDPVGQSQRVYDETAAALRTLIQRRVRELFP